MRFTLLISVLLLVASRSLANDTLIAAEPIEDKRLIRILASSEMRPLPAEAHIVRLYGISQEGDCVPDTHWVCSNDYYLAISTIDTAPDQSVYHLGSVGEITEVIALPAVPGAQDRLRITTANWPAAVVAAVPKLKRVERRFELRIFESRLEIRPGE